MMRERAVRPDPDAAADGARFAGAELPGMYREGVRGGQAILPEDGLLLEAEVIRSTTA